MSNQILNPLSFLHAQLPDPSATFGIMLDRHAAPEKSSFFAVAKA